MSNPGFNFDQVRSDPRARVAEYKSLVNAFYERTGDLFLEQMGFHYHFSVTTDTISAEDSADAIERAMAEEGGFKPGQKILDVGCGVGGPTLTVAKHSGANIIGINIIPRQIEIAQKRAAEMGMGDQVKFMVADAMNMPFGDNEFDHVYLFESGCYMPDKPRFLKECARVLKPGGLLLGQDEMMREGLTPAEQETYIEPICRSISVPYLATLSQMRTWLQEAGLVVECVEDLAKRGDLAHNWEWIDQSVADLKSRPQTPEVELMAAGGMALGRAGRAGALIIGRYRARKPA